MWSLNDWTSWRPKIHPWAIYDSLLCSFRDRNDSGVWYGVTPFQASVLLSEKWRLSEWIKEMWYFFTMECYSAIKRDKLLILTTVRINLRIIMSERKPDQKKRTCFYESLYIKSRKSTWTCSDWKQISGCLGTGQRKGWITKRKQEAFGAIGNGYRDYTDSFMSVHICQNWPNCILQMSVI